LFSEVKKLVKKINLLQTLIFASRGRTDGLISCQQLIFVDLCLTRWS